MLLVLPTTSATRSTSYLAPHQYEYYPSQAYYPYHNAPRFAAPSYSPQLEFFRRPSAEELEEHEYRRALEVVANHRRRQAEKEAAIHRQQLAEAARQRYFAALAAELEQQRQKELLAVRRAEFIRLQQAKARLIATERQRALHAFLRQSEGGQPITRQPHVVRRGPLVDALKLRLAGESDADITESIQNVLSSLEPRPVQSEKPEDSEEDAAKIIENFLSSIFPGLVSRTQPQSSPSTEQAQPSVSDKGKGKARAVDLKEPQKPAQKPKSTDEAFADILRHVMELSKAAPAPRSPDEAGPSRSPRSSPSTAQPAVTEKEQAQIERAIALSSVEHVQDTLTKLQTGFVLPTGLDHYVASADYRDETASVSSVSSSDLTKLIPYTSTNKPVYKYENELNGLLEELDRIDSRGDAEVREKRKEVVKAVEKALEGVEHAVGEAVEKRLSLTSTTTLYAEEPLKGFDVDGEVAEDVTPAPEQVETPAVADEVIAPESDVEASTATITPDSVEPASVTEPELTQPQVQVEAPETADTFLVPEQVTPPSPVMRPREIDTDTDEEVLVLDSDVEKSDWSELEEH